MGIFDLDNRFFRFVTKLMHLILLNILWVIFSFPIITIGPATVAVYYVTLRMARDEEGYIIKSFFKAFLQNFKHGVALEIILLFIGLVLYGDLRYFYLHESIFSYLFIAIFAIMTIIFVFAVIYTFPITARFKNKVSIILKNAFVISMKHLKTSVMLMIFLFVILYGIYTSVLIMVLFPIIAVSGFAYICSILLRNVFDEYELS